MRSKSKKTNIITECFYRIIFVGLTDEPKHNQKASESSKKSEGFCTKVLDSAACQVMFNVRDKVAEKMLQMILAFFACLSPCWKFLFLKSSNKMENDNGPSSTKSHGSKHVTRRQS